jgi:hypothetical protein
MPPSETATPVASILRSNPIRSPAGIIACLSTMQRLRCAFLDGDDVLKQHRVLDDDPCSTRTVPEMAFTTDTATETVVLRWADFARRIRPIVGDFAESPERRTVSRTHRCALNRTTSGLGHPFAICF